MNGVRVDSVYIFQDGTLRRHSLPKGISKYTTELGAVQGQGVFKYAFGTLRTAGGVAGCLQGCPGRVDYVSAQADVTHTRGTEGNRNAITEGARAPFRAAMLGLGRRNPRRLTLWFPTPSVLQPHGEGATGGVAVSTASLTRDPSSPSSNEVAAWPCGRYKVELGGEHLVGNGWCLLRGNSAEVRFGVHWALASRGEPTVAAPRQRSAYQLPNIHALASSKVPTTDV